MTQTAALLARIRKAGGSSVGLAPAGGSAGQVLKKVTGTDYDYSWQADATGGGGGWTTATVDFGATYTDGAEFTIVDAAVLATSTITAQFIGADTTADNTAEDHQYAAMFMRLATVPAAGSFTLQAQAMVGLISRTMKVRYQVA